jgi:hypothetical protein
MADGSESHSFDEEDTETRFICSVEEECSSISMPYIRQDGGRMHSSRSDINLSNHGTEEQFSAAVDHFIEREGPS